MPWILVAGLILAVPFLVYPDIDLTVSQWFYSAGEGFIYAQNPVVLAIYTGVRVFSGILITSLFCMLIWQRVFKDKPLPVIKKFPPAQKTMLFLLIAVIMGPGIFVHWGAKDNIGRPRPKQITEFGGALPYHAPFEINTANAQDARGKSFPSGHASMGFYLSVFALLAASRRRKILWYSAAISAGLLVGFARIVQGGHFLSDVLFAGVVVLFLNEFFHWLMYRRKKS